ncbi:unnamed protein product [Acanthoscelides obtectus]|uniref:Methyltransferase HEMK2 n=1 Tax=Acanthoscelides obtectus TaxID=200917 RepID=A0A9P0K1S8_ACAOB|nr:unnamed protein product [Acanthoscelides obtectus]CAK1658659.1 HemK methyltransferase family member 2 [Acanthoscelides obtectus]
MTLKTPLYDLKKFSNVYEPSEDTFLFIDAIEKDFSFLKQLKPAIAVEIGSGSGVVICSLAQIFSNSCTYFATDVNNQACLATYNTGCCNSVSINCSNMDLLSGFNDYLFDLILFNPPYVVTDIDEISGQGLNRAWAGGVCGRVIIDKLLTDVQKYLSPKGVLYLVLLKENKPEQIIDVMARKGFCSDLVLERRIPGEHLFIYKFYRK